MRKDSSVSSTSREQVMEPPSQVTPLGIELRPRSIGHRALDALVAGAAILISCISLYVAIQQSKTMEKTLAASSWPLLQFSSSNTDDQNNLSITLNVRNAGVGPAIVKRFRMIYGGRAYTNVYELLRDCCGYVVSNTDLTRGAGGPMTTSAPVESTVIRDGESTPFFIMPLGSHNAAAWKRLDSVRFKLRFDACYCSVLGDCWQSDLTDLDPRKVDECKPVADDRRK